MRRTLLVVLLMVWACACGDDAAPSNRAEVDAGHDAGATAPDAGEDGGPEQDAGHDAGAGDAGEDAAIDAGDPGPLGAGPLSLTFSGERVGIDVRASVTAELQQDGTLDAYQVLKLDGEPLPGEAPRRNDMSALEVHLDDFLVAGRWSDGTLGGTFHNLKPSYGPSEGFHYVVARAGHSVPQSGSGSYTLLASTKPTILDGLDAPGTVSGMAAVSFAGESTKLGFELTVIIGLDTYVLTTSGGVLDPLQSEVGTHAQNAFSGEITLAKAGAACAGAATGCGAFIAGLIVGENQERLGVAFLISGTGSGADGAHGVLVFEKQ